MPALYDSKQFEIISNKLPINWCVNQAKNGLLILGPSAWRYAGFWEDCYDYDPKALEIYKREAKIMYEEEGVSL